MAIILSNNFTKDFQNELLRIFKGYRNFTPKMQKQLEKLGFDVTYNDTHVKLTFYVNNNQKHVIVSHSASDLHSGRQVVRQIRREYINEL